MNANTLLAHFDRIAEAPDAVARLRRFVLDLAVRGKLVEQDPNDEPASELLKRIQAEKARLVNVGATKTSKPAGPLDETELPFDVPASWKWTRLSNLTSYIQRGKSPQYASGEGAPVISQKCVQWSGLDLTAARRITHESLHSYEDIRFLRDGDLLWNSTGTGTIGRVVRVRNPSDKLVCDSHVTVVRCLEVNPEYVRVWLRSDHVYGAIEDRATGATNQVELTAQMANSQVVPLPPLAEQHRIVARVNELMALCDRLEAAQTERERRRDRLVAASLHHLSNGAEPEERLERARFHLAHLPRLTTRVEHVQQMRQTILDLAVRGRLVAQDPSDEPVDTLLKRVDRERVLVAHEDRRADAAQQDLLAAELRWDIPLAWRWRALSDLSLFIDYRGKTPYKSSSGVRLITAKNVRRGFINLDPEEFISDETYRQWMTRGFPQIGDILFTTEAPMGNAAVVRLQEKFGLAQRAINLSPYAELNPDFLVLQLLAEPFQLILDKTATGLTAKGIKAAKLRRLPIAVAPLAEQHRIVARVDELMALCDRLEAQIVAGHEEGRRLLEAVLHNALAAG